jgi:hypothetical protein
MRIAFGNSRGGVICLVYIGVAFVLVSAEGVDSGRDGDGDCEQDFDGCPKRMAGLRARISSLDDTDNTDTYQKDSHPKQRQNPKLLHDLDLDRQDKVKRDSHEARVGNDVANLVGVHPDSADYTAMLISFDHIFVSLKFRTKCLDQDRPASVDGLASSRGRWKRTTRRRSRTRQPRNCTIASVRRAIA